MHAAKGFRSERRRAPGAAAAAPPSAPPALLPPSGAIGARRTSEQAFEQAFSLGAWDCRAQAAGQERQTNKGRLYYVA